MVGVGGLDCLGGAQLLSASVSWAPTAGGHTARQPLPSPSHLESTHETHGAGGGGWQQEEDGVRKEHLMLPLPTHECLLEKLDPATLFCFLALQMQYWAGSNSILFYVGLLSIYTDGSGPESTLEELKVWGGRYETGIKHCVVSSMSRRHRACGNTEHGLLMLPGGSGTASQKLRLEGDRASGLIKELGMVSRHRDQNMQKPFGELRRAQVADA